MVVFNRDFNKDTRLQNFVAVPDVVYINGTSTTYDAFKLSVEDIAYKIETLDSDITITATFTSRNVATVTSTNVDSLYEAIPSFITGDITLLNYTSSDDYTYSISKTSTSCYLWD